MKDSVGVKYKGNSTYNPNNAKSIKPSLDYVQGNQDYQGSEQLNYQTEKMIHLL